MLIHPSIVRNTVHNEYFTTHSNGDGSQYIKLLLSVCVDDRFMSYNFVELEFIHAACTVCIQSFAGSMQLTPVLPVRVLLSSELDTEKRRQTLQVVHLALM